MKVKARPANRILVVDDETSITGGLELILRDSAYEVQSADSIAQASRILSNQPLDLIITELRLPDGSGVDLLASVKRNFPNTEVILMTAFGSLDVAIEAIKRGAYYYLAKPYTPDQVLTLTSGALQFAAIRRGNQTIKRTLVEDGESFGMIGQHPKMLRIFDTIRTAAPSGASVLIEGETGTGKELIANAFHIRSTRAARPFIRINCAAIPHELIESELFGYRKGAFTGADRDKRGLIEAASGGTLLLDEIAEMPTHLQAKLLRVLQNGKLRRLGDEREIGVDFRLVSATNRDTTELLNDGTLRKDLYFRISTIKIKVPPLRERLDDLLLLANHFLDRYAKLYEKDVREISLETVTRLMRYDWPGNIRELESVIERAVLFSKGGQLVPECLPEDLQALPVSSHRFVIPPFVPMEEIEREAIKQTLERTRGNVRKSAQILQFPRPTFYRKLKRFGIKVERD